MSEALRARARSILLVADTTSPLLQLTGEYGQTVPTVGEGAGAGAAAGARVTGEMLGQDPRTLLFVPFVLPVAMVAGSIAGAAAAKVEQALAEFREDMAGDLAADSEGDWIVADLLADLETHIEKDPHRRVASDKADVVVEIQVPGITIETRDAVASVATRGRATVRDVADRSVLYSVALEYVERDTLKDWTADDNAAWAGYADRARRYLGRELTAALFETVLLRHVLRPKETAAYRGRWNGRVATDKPQLAWELFLLGGDGYEGLGEVGPATWELRLYDDARLVYEVQGLTDPRHTVTETLDECATLSWSVRPVYQIAGERRVGEWMSYRSNFDRIWHNETLEEHPQTPVPWAYFATMRTPCAR